LQLFDLKGRVAVVTGGNGGIGLGMAQGLAQAGASIVIAARDAAKSKAALATLAGQQGVHHFVACDVTDEEACRSLVATTLDRLGRLDILINNSGIAARKRPEDLSRDEWSSVLDVNLNGAFFLSQQVYAPMKRAGGGKIINIGSMLSIFGVTYAAAYGASKGAIVQLTKTLAVAWAADNIQVNAVLPGWIDTDLTRQARAQVPDLHDRIVGRTPAGRWGLPTDLAGVAVFLASSASDFVTGTAIPIDGGFSVQG
jgi:2-dehydro-3-deoxy-D-gluconate 5-dehydrogenase